MNKRGIYFAFSAALALTFLFSSVMTTYAMWSVQSDTDNAVSMGSVKVALEEEFEHGQVLMPGVTADKKVWAKNTGLLDIAVRIKITKLWGDPGPDGAFVPDKKISTDNIEIPYNQKDWYYNSKDDYFYYKGVLKPGQTTPPLFERFILSSVGGNELRNKHANIIVKAECVQAQGGGISFWGMSFEDLGVVYRAQAAVNITTRVHFASPATGFYFPDNGGDLFAAFKLLAPGESRSQTVDVKNEWNEATEIFLWAAVADQAHATAETLPLINQLLRQYTQLTITDGAGKLIYRGPVWGNPTSTSRDTDSMRYPYSLGSFAPGQTRTLHLSLTLDPVMDNQFKDLFGLINWVFAASGDLVEPSTQEQPVTVPTTTKKPGETTTKKPGETTTKKPGETTTQKPGETTTKKPGETTTKKPGETTTKKPAETTTKKSAETTTKKPGSIKTISEPPPKTGNENRVTFWASLSTCSGALLVAMLLAMKKQRFV